MVDRVELLRIPPHNIEAEQAVLGGIMLDNSALQRAKGIVTADDFYRRDHQLIYRAILDCEDRDVPFDVVTLGDWFEGHGQLEQVAGGSYLVELASTTPSALNIEGWATIVADHSRLRKVIHVGTEIVNDGFTARSEESFDVVARGAAALETVIRTKRTSGHTLRESLKETMSEVMVLHDSDYDGITGISTGYPHIDDATGGLQPGAVYGIGARPKQGKTTLGLNVMLNAAIEGRPGVIFSLEMKRKQLSRHLIASLARINSQKLKHPKLINEEEWASIHAAIARLRDLPLLIYDDTDATIDEMMAEASILKSRGQCDLAMLDYLQLVTPPRGMDRRDLEIGYITRAVKKTAMRLDIPFLEIFQLNRGSEQGTTPRPPRSSDARESGNIEQDLDSMWLLHRPRMYDKRAPDGCRLELAIQREGESGVVIRLEDKTLEYNLFMPSDHPWTDWDQSIARVEGKSNGRGKSHAAGDGDFF